MCRVHPHAPPCSRSGGRHHHSCPPHAHAWQCTPPACCVAHSTRVATTCSRCCTRAAAAGDWDLQGKLPTKQSEAQPASAALFGHTLPRMPRPTRSHAASACVIIVVIATLSLIQLAPRVPLLHQQTVSPFHLRAHRLPPLAQPLSRYRALPPAHPPTDRIQCACFRALFRAQRRVIQLRINSFALREMLEIQNAAADAWAAYARTGCMQRVAAATAMHLTRFWRRHDRR